MLDEEEKPNKATQSYRVNWMSIAAKLKQGRSIGLTV